MKTNKAFTLSEVLISLVLGGMIMTAAMSTFIFFAKSVVRAGNYIQMEQQTTFGLEKFGRDLRSAKSITSYGTPVTSISLTIPEEAGANSYNVTYSYDSVRKTFNRSERGAASIVLISDIGANTFTFNRYDLLQNITQTDYSTNQIQLSFTISPTTNGLVAQTTKNVISSRFVLRNR